MPFDPEPRRRSTSPSSGWRFLRTITRVPRRSHLVLALLVAAAVAIRLVYFLQISGTPFQDMDRIAQTDMRYYADWAQDIADGDWLSAHLAPPDHEWHREVAAFYREEHPAGQTTASHPWNADGSHTASALWAAWMHAPRFYQDPLYPYLLAATRRVLGPDVRWVFAWQLLLGVLSVLLIWDLSRRYFGDTVAAVAGLLALGCGPLVYYELLLLRDSLLVFAGLAVTWLAGPAFEREDRRRFVVLGLVIGLGALLKGSMLLFGGALGAAALVTWRKHPRRLAWTLGALGAGIACGLAPLAARNVAVGVPPLALAASGPLTFVVSNEPSTLPREGNYVNTQVVARFLGDTDGGWRAAIRSAMAGHTAGSFARLLAEKAYWAWHWFEMPNNDNYYYRQARVPVLRWLPVSAWMISPLALAGLAIGLRRRRQAWPLYALIAVSFTPLVLFYVIGRFRIALLAAAIPFAALTLVECVAAARQRRLSPACGVPAAIVLALCWTGRPLDTGMHLIRAHDWLLPYSVEYQPRMQAAGEAGDLDAAARICERSFDDMPTAEEMTASRDPALPAVLADLHMRCAGLWTYAGQPARARAQALLADALIGISRRTED